ncbi:MAG TPA: dihydrofolate reductase family protein [Propionibacteriaceae bacterium]|nr:dihydrofolate reductase family protein [Propionibacteriaceae bacterium]
MVQLHRLARRGGRPLAKDDSGLHSADQLASAASAPGGCHGQVIITTVITVDGLIEDPVPAPEGWLILEGDHEPPEFEMWQNAAGMLIGRKNYEGFAAYWPSAAGDGRWDDMLNPMPKWVASTTLTAPLEWNATLIEGDVAEAVQRQGRHDRDLISSGCGAFARFLVEHGLVDELMFWVNPTIQGPGDRPFHEGDPIDLKFLDSQSFESEVVLLRYQPAGRFAPKPLGGASAE